MVSTMQDDSKRTFRWVGWSLAIMSFAVFGVQLLAGFIIGRYFPALAESSYVSWILTAIGIYGVALPLITILLHKLPKENEIIPIRQELEFAPKQVMPLTQQAYYRKLYKDITPDDKLTPPEIARIVILIFGAMYISNFFGVILTTLIGAIKQQPVINPIMSMFNTDIGSIICMFVFGCVLSPIVEEVIFRKVLFKPISVFGYRKAIIFTSIMFGIFHGNLSQAPYAIVIGIILAYTVVRTGNIKLACILHIIVNTMGMFIAPLMSGMFSKSGEIFLAGTVILGFFALSTIIGAIVIFVQVNVRVRFEDEPIPQAQAVSVRPLYRSVGIILFYVYVAANIVLTIMA